jgi:hypothetical protein
MVVSHNSTVTLLAKDNLYHSTLIDAMRRSKPICNFMRCLKSSNWCKIGQTQTDRQTDETNEIHPRVWFFKTFKLFKFRSDLKRIMLRHLMSPSPFFLLKFI